MQKLYSNCLVILMLFLSCFASADQVSEKTPEPAELPSFFKKINKPIALSPTSIFYNQVMEARKLEDFENKFIIVHLWASWCMDCYNELIALNQLQKDFRKKPILVLAISEDFKAIDKIDSYFSKHKIDYLDIYIDKKSKIYKSLELNHLPVSYLIDFDDKVIASSVPGSFVDWSDEDLRDFLEERAAQYQLLPPEYKKQRDKYEAVPEVKKKKIERPKSIKTKTRLFIN